MKYFALPRIVQCVHQKAYPLSQPQLTHSTSCW